MRKERTTRESPSAIAIVVVIVVIGLLGIINNTFSGSKGGDGNVAGATILSTDGLMECEADSDLDTAAYTNIWDGDDVQYRTRARFRGGFSEWSPWRSVSDSCSGSILTEWYCEEPNDVSAYTSSSVTCAHGCITTSGRGRCRLPTCTDSDGSGGKSASTSTLHLRTLGTTTGLMVSDAQGLVSETLGVSPSQEARRYMDSCATSTSVYEYQCRNRGVVPAGTPADRQVERLTVPCPADYPDCVKGKCVAASPPTCTPSLEVCGNGVDEDCDGVDVSCPAAEPAAEASPPPPSPSSTSPSCTDSDGGNARDVPGTTTSADALAQGPTRTSPEIAGTPVDGGLYEYRDSCSADGRTLYQYSCLGTDVRQYEYACPPRIVTPEANYGSCITDATGSYCPSCVTNPTAAGCSSS